MRTEFSPVECKVIAISDVTNKPQAHLTQVVSSYYPSMRVDSSTSTHLFSEAQLDIESDPFETTRNYFMKLTDAITLEMVEAQLKAFPNARILRTLASAPMFSDEHLSAVAAGLITKEAIAKAQLVVYGKEHKQAGQAILHNGIKQYRRFDFQKDGGEDTDHRLSASDIVTVVPA